MYMGGQYNFVKDTKQFKDYKKWLASAKPGERFNYFTGNAISETIVGATIGKMVRDDYQMGYVYLFQQKVAPYVYKHITVRSKRPLIMEVAVPTLEHLETKD